MVHFTDEKIETSTTLEFFLDLIQHGSICYYRPSPHTMEAVNLILFLRKYACKQWVKPALLGLKERYQRGWAPVCVPFMAACVAEDYEIVTALLEHQDYPQLKPLRPCSKTCDKSTVGDRHMCGLDVRGYFFEQWSLVPSSYVFAITQAYTASEKYSHVDLKKGEVFEEIMEIGRYRPWALPDV